MKRLLGFVLSLLLLFCCACTGDLTVDPTESSVSSAVPASSVPPVSSEAPVSSEPPVSSEAPFFRNATEYYDFNFANYYLTHEIDPDISLLDGERIRQAAVSGLCTVLLTESGRVVARGLNSDMDLGQGTCEPILKLCEIRFPEKIKLITGGSGGYCAVGESNQIYFWGDCFDFTYEIEELQSPIGWGCDIVTVPFDKEVADISFRYRKFVILTTEGEVYALGETFNNYWVNPTDVLDPAVDGYDWTKENYLVPQKISVPEPVVQIEAAAGGMFLLGAGGTCYTAFNPQFANYPCEKIPGNPYLRKIVFDRPIRTIRAGDEALFILTPEGEVYAAGSNTFLSFGIGQKENSDNWDPAYTEYWVVKRFVRIPIPERVTQIDRTGANCRPSFLTESGRVYITGENFMDWSRVGQEWQKDDNGYIHTQFLDTPHLMQLPEPAVKVCTRGADTWYFTEDGRCFAFGLNTYGTAIGVPRAFPVTGQMDIIREPVELPLNFTEDFSFR